MSHSECNLPSLRRSSVTRWPMSTIFRHRYRRTGPSTHGLGVIVFSLFLFFVFSLLGSLAHAGAPQALPADFSLPADLIDSTHAPTASPKPLYSAAPVTPAAKSKVRKAFEEILTSPSIRGHKLSAKVVALSSGQVVYEQNADQWLKPASNIKLLTTAAAFSILGEDWRPASRVLSTRDVKDGTIAADVALHGVHDLSWSKLFYPSATYPAERLVEQLYDRGIRRIDGDVIIHGLFVVYGYHFGTLDTAVEREQAAEVLRKALIKGGIQVKGAVKVSHSPLPNTYPIELARWEGPSLAPIVDEINRASHNEFADMLLLAIAQSDGGGASYVGGARVIRSWLTHQGYALDGLEIHDGSGLSHSNRLSAELLTQIIRAAQTKPWAALWNDSLSAAGVDGTYVNRMLGPTTRGLAWMKSGTINGVVSSSGLLYHAATGETYAISLLLNDIRNQPSARIVLDKLITAVAGIQPDKKRPTIPLFESARLHDDDHVHLRWRKTPNTSKYIIETRDETSTWRQARIVDRGTTDIRLPRGSAPRAYRIRAFNDTGISDASGVLIAGGPHNAGRVILVDGNERWLADAAEQKNARKVPHAFLTSYLGALTGYRVESMTNHALLTQSIPKSATVLFALGREANDTEALSHQERRWIEAYVKNGGRIIVSGAEAAWDLQTHVNDGPDYMDRVFGAAFIADSADDTVACISDEIANQTQSSNRCGHFWSRGRMQIKWPDALTTTSGRSCMRYGNQQSHACIYQDNAALVGFPLESINSPQDRRAVIRALLKLVGTPDGSDKS